MGKNIDSQYITSPLNRPTYEIVEGGKAIKCLKCGRTSYNSNDVKYLYCGNCHGFHKETPGTIKQGGV